MSKPSYEELLQRIEKLEKRKKQILWENPKPAQNFGVQTITFENPDEIKDVFLVCSNNTSNSNNEYFFPCTLGKNFRILVPTPFTPGAGNKGIELYYSSWIETTLTSINFTDRYDLVTTLNSNSILNSQIIPLRIEER